jgi:hypothetical protein
MTPPLGGDALQAVWQRWSTPLPAHRKPGPKTRSRIQAAPGGACGLFFTPAPSGREAPRRLPPAQGHNNACPLFGVQQMPCHQPLRHLLAPMRPTPRAGGYLAGVEGRAQHGWLGRFRVRPAPRWGALAGTPSPASDAMHCPHGRRRQRSPSRPLASPRAPQGAWAPAAQRGSPGPPHSSCRKPGLQSRTARGGRATGGVTNPPRWGLRAGALSWARPSTAPRLFGRAPGHRGAPSALAASPPRRPRAHSAGPCGRQRTPCRRWTDAVGAAVSPQSCGSALATRGACEGAKPPWRGMGGRSP